MNSLRQFTRHKALQSLAVTPSQDLHTIRLWNRHFSSTPAVASRLAGLDPSKLKVTKTSTPKELTPAKDLVFGKTFTGRCNPQP